jgi:hypothetical protein
MTAEPLRLEQRGALVLEGAPKRRLGSIGTLAQHVGELALSANAAAALADHAMRPHRALVPGGAPYPVRFMGAEPLRLEQLAAEGLEPSAKRCLGDRRPFGITHIHGSSLRRRTVNLGAHAAA